MLWWLYFKTDFWSWRHWTKLVPLQKYQFISLKNLFCCILDKRWQGEIILRTKVNIQRIMWIPCFLCLYVVLTRPQYIIKEETSKQLWGKWGIIHQIQTTYPSNDGVMIFPPNKHHFNPNACILGCIVEYPGLVCYWAHYHFVINF